MHITRFYQKEFPDHDDIVMVQINKESEYGYNCVLLEYGNMEGFLSISELVKGKYVKKHLLKSDEVCSLTVIKVDPHKKLVDLSRKRMNDADTKLMTIKYDACSKINKLMNECYIMHIKYCNINNDQTHPIDQIMNDTIWKLYNENNEDTDYDTLYRNILENLNLLFPSDLFSDEFVDKAKNNIIQRIVKNDMTMESDLTLLVTKEDAVSKIKQIFTTSLITYDKYQINILICSPPHYKIRIMGPCKIKAQEILEEIKQNIVDNSKQYSAMLKFGDIKVREESQYKIKFLGTYDLQRIEFF